MIAMARNRYACREFGGATGSGYLAEQHGENLHLHREVALPGLFWPVCSGGLFWPVS